MSYQAIISNITVYPHPNADRLQLASAKGYTFVVGADARTNDLYVIFPDDGILMDEFCKQNDLYPRVDDNGNRAGGYFKEGNARVRAQNFRKVKSECFGMPVSCLAYTKHDLSKLRDGDMFDTLNGHKICEKYYTPATLRAMKGGTLPKTKTIQLDFPEHKDTTQWRFAALPDHCLVHITEKIHGTSVRVKHTVVKRKVTGFKAFLNKFGFKFVNEKMEYVLGTRRTVLKTDPDGNHVGGFYAEKGDAAQPYILALDELRGKLKPEVQVYGEIVGYMPGGKALFAHSTEEDKDLKKKYGPVIDYSYGNPVGQAAFYVYRVTDHGRDLSFFETQAFCKSHGLKMVPYITSYHMNSQEDKASLDAIIESHLEGPSTLDERHIREGVCILVESQDGSKIYKSKSFSFRLLEGLVKQDENYVDAEEVA